MGTLDIISIPPATIACVWPAAIFNPASAMASMQKSRRAEAVDGQAGNTVWPAGIKRRGFCNIGGLFAVLGDTTQYHFGNPLWVQLIACFKGLVKRFE